MKPVYRLLTIAFIWAITGWLGFFALGQSLFMPQQTVMGLFALTMMAGVAATFIVARMDLREGIERR